MDSAFEHLIDYIGDNLLCLLGNNVWLPDVWSTFSPSVYIYCPDGGERYVSCNFLSCTIIDIDLDPEGIWDITGNQVVYDSMQPPFQIGDNIWLPCTSTAIKKEYDLVELGLCKIRRMEHDVGAGEWRIEVQMDTTIGAIAAYLKF